MRLDTEPSIDVDLLVHSADVMDKGHCTVHVDWSCVDYCRERGFAVCGDHTGFLLCEDKGDIPGALETPVTSAGCLHPPRVVVDRVERSL